MVVGFVPFVEIRARRPAALLSERSNRTTVAKGKKQIKKKNKKTLTAEPMTEFSRARSD